MGYFAPNFQDFNAHFHQIKFLLHKCCAISPKRCCCQNIWEFTPLFTSRLIKTQALKKKVQLEVEEDTSVVSFSTPSLYRRDPWGPARPNTPLKPTWPDENPGFRFFADPCFPSNVDKCQTTALIQLRAPTSSDCQ